MTKEEKTVENAAPPEKGVSAAKKFMLKDLKVEDADIKAIRTNAEADELIEYLEKKNTEKPKENMGEIKVNNLGHNPAKLPAPDKTNAQKNIRLNMLDKLDPLSYKKALATQGTRRNNGSRLLVLFDEEHPGGRVF